jgi:hypothetical protein
MAPSPAACGRPQYVGLIPHLILSRCEKIQRSPGHHVDGGSRADILVGRSAQWQLTQIITVEPEAIERVKRNLGVVLAAFE